MGTSPALAKVTVLVSDHELLWADSQGQREPEREVTRVYLGKRLRPRGLPGSLWEAVHPRASQWRGLS